MLDLKSLTSNNYNSAKRESINFLNDNKLELEEIFDEIILNSSNGKDGKYKEKFYIYYIDFDNQKYIKLDIDSQGMLGGQYWGIIYCPSDDLLGNDNIKIYDENTETSDGNNIFIKEKVKDKWYFYYENYDGKVDIKEIEKD